MMMMMMMMMTAADEFVKYVAVTAQEAVSSWSATSLTLTDIITFRKSASQNCRDQHKCTFLW